MSEKFSDIQIKMLQAGEFYMDNVHQPIHQAMELVEKGYLTFFESGSNEAQYTALNFSRTNEGKIALQNYLNK